MGPHRFILSSLAFSIVASTACPAQSSVAKKQAYYFDPAVLHGTWLVGAPPAAKSAEESADLAAVRESEERRTPSQAAQASADDKEQDIFIYAPVVGAQFSVANFPITGALSAHIHSDEGIASDPLKTSFARLRPYQFDKDLHPVCRLTDVHNSYPSGHALGGYLFALTLVEILPEKRDAILQRADQYAHNRIVCGVHYPSDLRASRDLAYAVFGNMLASPQFQKDLTAARNEVRTKLNLAPIQ